MSCKIVYNPGPGNVTLTLVRGPVNFRPYTDGRVNDNLATSGKVRERVVENLDVLIAFDMPHMVVTDDLVAWGQFEAFALAGSTFQFYPCTTLSDFYNCVAEDTKWEPQRNAPGKYGASVVFRILEDAQAPAGPEIVLKRFYGLT